MDGAVIIQSNYYDIIHKMEIINSYFNNHNLRKINLKKFEYAIIIKIHNLVLKLLGMLLSNKELTSTQIMSLKDYKTIQQEINDILIFNFKKIIKWQN